MLKIFEDCSLNLSGSDTGPFIYYEFSFRNRNKEILFKLFLLYKGSWIERWWCSDTLLIKEESPER